MNLLKLLLIISFVGVYSAETRVPFELFRLFLPENPVIIEAGAQFGEDSVKLSAIWPNGFIYAFEPSPVSYSSLAQAASTRSNLLSFQLALSNESGKLPLYLSGGASSLLTPQESFNRDYFHVDLDHPVFVEVVQLDQWLDQLAIPTVDFLWLDMEGNELNALKGVERRLANVSLIYTEVNIQRFWNDCVCYDELKDYLLLQGFQEIWSEICPAWQGNALFLNTKLYPDRISKIGY